MIAPMIMAVVASGSRVRRQQIAAPHMRCVELNVKKTTDPVGCGTTLVITTNTSPPINP
jgi:hypothetical protein